MPTIPLSSGFSIISRDFFTNYVPKTYMLSKGNELVFPPILNKITPLENGDYEGALKCPLQPKIIRVEIA